MENIVLDCIAKRRSIRKYNTETITPEEIDALVQAAIISPSAMNRQPWHISVIQNAKIIEEMELDIVEYFRKHGPKEIVESNRKKGNKIFYGVPLLFVVSAPDQDALMDVGIVAQSIHIAAKSLDLGSVTLGLPQVCFVGEKEDYWKEQLEFPKGYTFGIAVAVGHGTHPGVHREADQSKVSYIK